MFMMFALSLTMLTLSFAMYTPFRAFLTCIR